MLTDTSHSPHAKLRSAPFRDVEWTEGFWADRFAVCSRTMVANMWRLLDDPKISHNVANFRIAAGLEPGVHSGPPFGDGDLYKWLEAASFVYGKDGDGELGRIIDRVIELIRSVQRDDGYIFTKQAIRGARGAQALEPLANQLDFEVYNLGHLMTAACVHARATGKPDLLEIAERAARYLERTFETVSPGNAKTAVCPSHYMGLIELYRATRNDRYLALARRLIAMRDLVQSGTDDNQDRIPLAAQRRAIGHAVRANYLYAGLADLYAETGEAYLLEVLESCWRSVVEQKMYITGSCGALYDGVSPYGSSNHDEIQRIHQAYGREYELPNTTAYNETCAAVGNILWNWRMLNLSAEARFADVIERVLYNGALAGINLEGNRYFYSNALRRHLSLPFSLKWSRQREPYLSSFCCPPNLVRTIAESSCYAYALGDAAIYTVLYGGSRATLALSNGARILLVQTTGYPWDGRVHLRFEQVSGPKRFALNLRVPGWLDGAPAEATVAVNGTRFAAKLHPGSFFPIERDWHAGDEVQLTVPMEVRAVEAHPLVEETRGQIAIERGPIVYCLEGVDLPEGASIAEIRVPADVSWKADYEFRIGAERMVALEGAVLRRKEGAWGDGLYRTRSAPEYENVKLRLIPYFAWDNRGFGEMSVWLTSCC